MIDIIFITTGAVFYFDKAKYFGSFVLITMMSAPVGFVPIFLE
jgi:hypothetical protein